MSETVSKKISQVGSNKINNDWVPTLAATWWHTWKNNDYIWFFRYIHTYNLSDLLYQTNNQKSPKCGWFETYHPSGWFGVENMGEPYLKSHWVKDFSRVGSQKIMIIYDFLDTYIHTTWVIYLIKQITKNHHNVVQKYGAGSKYLT